MDCDFYWFPLIGCAAHLTSLAAFLQLMWLTYSLLATGGRIQQNIYHLSFVNDDCIHSGFAIITLNVQSQRPSQNY